MQCDQGMQFVANSKGFKQRTLVREKSCVIEQEHMMSEMENDLIEKIDSVKE